MKKKARWPIIASLMALSLLLLACASPAGRDEVTAEEEVIAEEEVETVVEEKITHQEMPPIEVELEIKETSSGVKYIVDPAKIIGGGPPKDGIPSIDDPEFVSLEEADQWIQDNELVIVIIYKGEERVYPLQIMVWHEIVNEVIAGDPLLVTY